MRKTRPQTLLAAFCAILAILCAAAHWCLSGSPSLEGGGMNTRKAFIRDGLGLAAILSTQKCPAIMRSMLGARSAIMGGQKVPYDARVEYLESTGTQLINTGYAVTTDNVRISARYAFTSSTASSTVWGSQTSSDKNWLANQWAGQWWFGTTSGQFGGSQGTNVRDVEWNISNGSVSGTVGGTSYSGTYIGSVVSESPVYLFAVNSGGSAQRLSNCRLYRFTLYDNGVLVRDFQPVRFTNELGVSEGAMYDRANPTVGMNPDGAAREDGLYRNRGTGAFMIGPDNGSALGLMT